VAKRSALCRSSNIETLVRHTAGQDAWKRAHHTRRGTGWVKELRLAGDSTMRAANAFGRAS